MAFNAFFLLGLFTLCTIIMVPLVSFTDAIAPILNVASLNRSNFPTSFIFGTASSAYQYEGAAKEGGRGASIWDTFTHKYPDKIKDKRNADVPIDEYHRYKEDVGIMKYMNLDAYKFSISWSRILPKGRLSGGINQEGIKYYNNLINELVANGLQLFVTLFHWDLPQALEDEYGGFLSPHIVNDFRDYAELCFKEFGDRVKHWITVNEPSTYSTGGYVIGMFPPGRCSNWMNLNCTGGDSGTEPYLVSHHLLLAHAAAVQVYKTKYQVQLLLKSQNTSQSGWIGITLISHWFVPFSDNIFDQKAVGRALDFMFGWFMAPLTTGDYPQSMRSLVGQRLPKFSKEQAHLLNGSFDFLGLNYYTSQYAANAPHLSNIIRSYLTDSLVNLTYERNGIPIGPKAASDWLYVYPRGFQELLLYIKKKYNNPLIYITENGIDEFNDPTLSLDEALVDIYRIDYYYDHLFYLQSAIRKGVNVRGYFAWSLLDNFEWAEGYTVRFGINFVDYNNDLKRYQKLSAEWFKKFLKKY
ncbi:beta-glucosidase 13-like [Gastrolobium bilobum]|uniref:beta-glucosidase 13-like n=1 Tax=Gastrolobium bilobum TaxID=150636 RepID=UPI002AB2062A|nr:beta-glucosidase 13-like [Gastrolobium bilobum]